MNTQLAKNKLNNLYQEDFYLWVQKTTDQLREKNLVDLDWHHLIEELEGLGREQKHKVESYLRQLLKHLLLYQYWETEKLYSAKGWADEIDNFRAELEILLRSKTLLNYFQTIISPTYKRARKSAIKKSQLDIFPEICPYSLEEILDSEWLPE